MEKRYKHIDIDAEMQAQKCRHKNGKTQIDAMFYRWNEDEMRMSQPLRER
ncbi:hypothetical protein [Paenibacillus sp. NAIST15-1]|nr:hypothetical protein [Paenibacillus sp. NAIST15-1]GAV14286.1 hypothetical protein PBN151_4248 [Paenibacillus sp. NAIST15-1]